MGPRARIFVQQKHLLRSQRTLSVRPHRVYCVCGVHSVHSVHRVRSNRSQRKISVRAHSVRGNRGQCDVETGLNFPRWDSPPPPHRLPLNLQGSLAPTTTSTTTSTVLLATET